VRAIMPATHGRAEDEIFDPQALHRRCRAQDERQPRGCILEGFAGDRRQPAHDLVRLGRYHRFEASAWQSVVRHSYIRARILPRRDFKAREERVDPACTKIEARWDGGLFGGNDHLGSTVHRSNCSSLLRRPPSGCRKRSAIVPSTDCSRGIGGRRKTRKVLS
jgi:hypothetical protein